MGDKSLNIGQLAWFLFGLYRWASFNFDFKVYFVKDQEGNFSLKIPHYLANQMHGFAFSHATIAQLIRSLSLELENMIFWVAPMKKGLFMLGEERKKNMRKIRTVVVKTSYMLNGWLCKLVVQLIYHLLFI